MKILVTGGSGFIGGHVVQELESRGLGEVWVCDLKPPNFITDAIYCEQNLLHLTPADVSGMDLVIHAAGILGTSTTFAKIDNTYEVNIMGMLNLMQVVEGASKRPRVVHTGLIRDWYCPYMITKHAGTKTGIMYAIETGIEFLDVGMTVVYGPRQHWEEGKVIPIFLTRALANQPLQIYGDGTSTINMMYVKDVARLIVDLALNDQIFKDKCYATNLASTNKDMMVVDLAELILAMTGSTAGVEFIEMRPGQPKEGDPAKYDLTNIQKYIPDLDRQFVSLENGLSRSIEWYKGVL